MSVILNEDVLDARIMSLSHIAQREFEGFDYKTIADILHIPVSTVGVRLSRGKQQLKKLLDK